MSDAVLTAWRDEISQELLEVHQQLNDARHEFADATETARDERRALNDLMLTLSGHDGRTALAAALQRRISDKQDVVRRSLGAATRCEGAVTALIGKIADLEMALMQIGALQSLQVVEAAV